MKEFVTAALPFVLMGLADGGLYALLPAPSGTVIQRAESVYARNRNHQRKRIKRRKI